MNNHSDLINRAQSDLSEFGQISARDAQALIDALNELASSKVFVCNDAPVFEGAQVFADSIVK